MHKYQKISFLAVALTVGISATASAQSFPQDYLNKSVAAETKYVVLDETQKVPEGNKIYANPSFSYHLHRVANTAKAPRPVEFNANLVEMSDAKSQSNFHLFNQYL
ncbi:hypothetical protein [Methylophaga sp.]|uniref:hypothetical protein n=1 Tax=Methylophaga sp. TaxID=2024840 RepID=UPI003F69DF98